MEITWFGEFCFTVTSNDGASVLISPLAENAALNDLTVDIITRHTNDIQPPAGLAENARLIPGPGEYEVKNIFTFGLATYPRKRPEVPVTALESEGTGGAENASPASNNNPKMTRNVVFTFLLDEVRVCHLGALTRTLSKQEIENLGNIDILMLPVGGNNALNAAQASEVISLLEPLIIIPMNYQSPSTQKPLEPLDRFIKEMGLSELEAQDTLRVSRTSLPLETQVVILTETQA